MIDFKSIEITEPPLLSSFSLRELEQLVACEFDPKIKNIPCHTQAVERTVKMVTEASKRFSSTERRDGSIRATKKAREACPSQLIKKSNYKPIF